MDIGHTSPNQSSVGLGNSNQIWQWKVVFNFVSLVGFFLLIVPVMGLLLKLPVFKWAVSHKNDTVPMGSDGGSKLFYWIILLVSSAIPAFLIPTFLERRADELLNLRNTSLIIGGIFLVVGTYFFVRYHQSGDDNSKANLKLKFWGGGGVVIAALCGVTALLSDTSASIMNTTGFFVAPSINTIGYWAIMSAAIASVFLAFMYYFARKPLGATPANYGLSVKIDTILASFLTAVVGVALVYAVLFITEAIFRVDGRIWTIGIRIFTFEHVLALFRYAPFLFVFYFVNTIAVCANTRGKKFGDLIAVFTNAGFILIWVAIQYIILFSTGVAWHPSMALNSILLFALIPILSVAAVYARRLYEKTNNVFLAAFTNTIFLTMITIANTAVFWNMGRTIT